MNDRITGRERASDYLQDARRVRGQKLVAFVLDALGGDIIQDHDRRVAANRLLEAFMNAGADLVTDYDRESCGLPKRGTKGWTPEELITMEARRLEIMAGKREYIVPSFQPPPLKKGDNLG